MFPFLFIRTQPNTNKIKELYTVTGSVIKRQSVISINHLISKDRIAFCRIIIERPLPEKRYAEYYVFDYTGRAFIVRVEHPHYDKAVDTALRWIDQVDIRKSPSHTGVRMRYAIKTERILSTHVTEDEKMIIRDFTRYILHSYPHWLKGFITDTISPHCPLSYMA